ncbi:MAG: TolC family protein [Candidatus Tectomicrobia bacterium]|uniref:TolC family protein n=1 Tax=Tectimicrobiota bacterium TaxID=2528274 RepID=A0A932M234_UNCTE|nr:TolC family protein [Candidatus Tectomicrobia bacterium]
MNILKFILTVLVVVLFSHPLLAQEVKPAAEAEPLSLTQALSVALQNSPLLKASEQEVAMALAKVGQARAQLLPRIDVGTSFHRTTSPLMAFGDRLNQERVTTGDFDPRRLNDPAAISNFNTYLEITQPVYNGGKEWTGLNQSRLAHEAKQREDRRTLDQLRFDVTQAYYGVILGREQLQVARETLKTAEAHEAQARSLFRAGLVVESDVLSAEVRLAQVREFLIAAENGLTLSRSALNTIMGVDEARAFRVTEALKFFEFKQDPEELKRRALRSRADLEALRVQVRVAEQGVRLARSDYLPRLNLGGRYDLNEEHFLGTRGESWTGMVTLSINLFDGLGTSSRVEEARAGVLRVKALQERLEQGISLQVRQAHLDLLTARGRIQASEKAVDQARESLRITQNRYNSGLTTIVELLDGEVRLTEARMRTLQALYDYAVAKAKIDLAVGEEL